MELNLKYGTKGKRLNWKDDPRKAQLNWFSLIHKWLARVRRIFMSATCCSRGPLATLVFALRCFAACFGAAPSLLEEVENHDRPFTIEPNWSPFYMTKQTKEEKKPSQKRWWKRDRKKRTKYQRDTLKVTGSDWKDVEESERKPLTWVAVVVRMIFDGMRLCRIELPWKPLLIQRHCNRIFWPLLQLPRNLEVSILEMELETIP